MKNMYAHELKEYLKSTIIWVLSLVAVAAFFLSIYSTLIQDIGAVQTLIEGLPEAMKKAFNISLDSYASLTGFYSMVLTYVMLAGSIQAMIIGTSIVSKEERGKTAEFLLAKPVTRAQILNAKLAAGLTVILATNAVFLISMPFMLDKIAGESIGFKTYLLLTLTLLFVELFFLGLGFLISVSAPKFKSVLSVSLTTVFGFYILGTLDSIIGGTAIRYFTPFKYYDFRYIAKHGAYEITFAVLEAVLIILAITTSYYVYIKRDIHST